MKKMFIMLLLVTATSLNTLLANESSDVSWMAKQTFAKEFPGASYVKWESLKDAEMYMVRFVFNQQGLVAYVDESGALLATVRLVEKEALPFAVNKVMDREFSEFDILQIEEISTAHELCYIISIEDKKQRKILRISNNGVVDVLKRERNVR